MPEQNDKIDLNQKVEDKVANEVISANADRIDGADVGELKDEVQAEAIRVAEEVAAIAVKENEEVLASLKQAEAKIADLEKQLKAAKDEAKAARVKKNKIVSTEKPAADYRLVRDLRRNDLSGERTCCSCTKRKPIEFFARCGERCLECA